MHVLIKRFINITVKLQTPNFNGKTYNQNWFSHQALMQGALINIGVGATPNKNRGTHDNDFPFSLSGKN